MLPIFPVGLAMSVERFLAWGVVSQWGITYFGEKMAHGLSTGFDLKNRLGTDDVYLDVGGLAMKFDL